MEIIFKGDKTRQVKRNGFFGQFRDRLAVIFHGHDHVIHYLDFEDNLAQGTVLGRSLRKGTFRVKDDEGNVFELKGTRQIDPTQTLIIG